MGISFQHCSSLNNMKLSTIGILICILQVETVWNLPETEKIDQFGSQDCKCFDINSTCKDLCPKLGFPKGQMSEIKEFTDSLPCSDVPQYCACIKCKKL